MREKIQCIKCDNHHFVINFPYLRRDKILECPCCHTVQRLSKATKELSFVKVKHRKPKTPYWNKGPGFCRWCGKTVIDIYGVINKRRKWHETCLHEYFLQSDPTYARKHVWEKSGGVCAKCTKTIYGDWDLDYITPLIDGGSHGIENMQILCKPCHIEKTRHEAKKRSKKE